LKTLALQKFLKRSAHCIASKRNGREKKSADRLVSVKSADVHTVGYCGTTLLIVSIAERNADRSTSDDESSRPSRAAAYIHPVERLHRETDWTLDYVRVVESFMEAAMTDEQPQPGLWVAIDTFTNTVVARGWTAKEVYAAARAQLVDKPLIKREDDYVNFGGW
jgi:hypothetical protein